MNDPREGLTPVDFELRDEGSITIVCPRNDWAGDWLYEHVHDPQWWGDGVVVATSLLSGLLGGIEAEDGVWAYAN